MKNLMKLTLILLVLSSPNHLEAREVVAQLKDLNYLKGTRMLSNILSKELCSCFWTTRTYEKVRSEEDQGFTLDECLERNHFPKLAARFAKQEIIYDVDKNIYGLRVYKKIEGGFSPVWEVAESRFVAGQGCTLLPLYTVDAK